MKKMPPRNQIEELCDMEWTTKKIADFYGVTSTSVKNWLKAYGLETVTQRQTRQKNKNWNRKITLKKCGEDERDEAYITLAHAIIKSTVKDYKAAYRRQYRSGGKSIVCQKMEKELKSPWFALLSLSEEWNGQAVIEHLQSEVEEKEDK